MDSWIIDLIERGGYAGIALLMALENIFPPIPSELIMGLGGIAVARGSMEFWTLLLVGTAGSTAGNYVWFLIGDRLGYERLKPFVDRWGRWLTMDWHDVQAASGFFQRHGRAVVFFLRFSPLLRTMISLPAGLAHMRHVPFLVFTFAGAAMWNAALILVGRWLAGYIGEMQNAIGYATLAVMAIGLSVYVWRVVRWKPRA